MADFEYRVNESDFERLGVRVNFDENRYGALLDSLVEVVPVDKSPLITLTPAPIWGMNEREKFRNTMLQQENHLPSVKYEAKVNMIRLQADKSESVTSGMLLRGTRQWAGELKGEKAEFIKTNWQRRHFRRGILTATIGAGAVAGYEIMGGDSNGTMIGGIIGAMFGIAINSNDKYKNPYFLKINEFVNDPDVQAEFGKIVSYQTT